MQGLQSVKKVTYVIPIEHQRLRNPLLQSAFHGIPRQARNDKAGFIDSLEPLECKGLFSCREKRCFWGCSGTKAKNLHFNTIYAYIIGI